MDCEYVESVLDVVELVPPARVTTYGDVALVVAGALGRGGPRQVGAALREAGGAVPWWRVVSATGEPPAHHRTAAHDALRAEGCPLRPDGRVDLRRARVDGAALAAAFAALREDAFDGAPEVPHGKVMDVTGSDPE